MRRWSVTGLVAVALVASACGSGTAPKATSHVATVKLLSSAPERAATAGSARFAMTMTLPAGKDDTVVRASGVVDLDHANMQMSMNMRDLAPDAPPIDIEMRMVDGVIYMNFGDLAGQMGIDGLVDTPWLKLDPTELGVPQSALQQQQNPADLLQTLRGIGDVEAVGRATIRGVDTTEYRGKVDIRKALDRLGSDATDEMKRGLETFDAGTIPVRVWMDDDGLPRREEIEVTAAGQTFSVRMDFFDYGVPAAVEAPPADQVGSFSDLLGSPFANAA